MLRKIRIQNYKSILDDTLELGRVNVFIGENGCGKTNILEALAMAGAALHGDLDAEGLFNRGIRLARASLTRSAFAGHDSGDEIVITLGEAETVRIEFVQDLPGATSGRWRVVQKKSEFSRVFEDEVTKIIAGATQDATKVDQILRIDFEKLLRGISGLNPAPPGWREMEALQDFVIYDLNTPALRGLQSTSRKEPLGIYGEGLDTAIAAFDEAQRTELTGRASCISWVDQIDVDVGDKLKLQGFKLGRGTSRLYFLDRFMAADNNVFSAENANEGILHVLFHLALFTSRETPPILGIDNIETALNPQLCRQLIKQLVELACKHAKQALITTHNPATLDGLNLHDDEQRLFVVERNDEGHTSTRRVQLKPDAGDGQKYKLSELWMRGHLGGLPRGFRCTDADRDHRRGSGGPRRRHERPDRGARDLEA
jgi:predicted ATPase